MRLRDYIVKNSEPGAPLGSSNPEVRRLAILCDISAGTIHRLSIGDRFVSRKVAEKIRDATDNKVPLKEMVNANRKRPGPKPRNKRSRKKPA
jgi:hypothetical protein